MAEQRKNTVVGVFVLAGLLAMASMVFAFGGGRSLFKRTYDIQVWFDKGVIGVQEGQGVTLYGKRIGETKAVRFRDGDLSQGVVVIVAIDGNLRIPRSARVLVPENVMGIGRPIIELVVADPDDPEVLPQDGKAEIHGYMVDVTDKVLGPDMLPAIKQTAAEIKGLAHDFRPVAREIARILEERDMKDVDVKTMTANLDTFIQRADATLKGVNEILGDKENQANVRAALVSFRKMAESGVGAMDDARTAIGQGKLAMQDARALFERVAVTTDDLSSVLKHMDETLVSLNTGTGTAALLLKDNRLYEELVLATRRLTQTLDETREVFELLKQGEIRVNPW